VLGDVELSGNADAIIANPKHEPVTLLCEAHSNFVRVGVTMSIGQSFLRNSQQRYGSVHRDAAIIFTAKLHVEPGAPRKSAAKQIQGIVEPAISQFLRIAQEGDRPDFLIYMACRLVDRVDQLGCIRETGTSPELSYFHAKFKEQIAGGIVQLLGEPAPFRILSFKTLVEALRRGMAQDTFAICFRSETVSQGLPIGMPMNDCVLVLQLDCSFTAHGFCP